MMTARATRWVALSLLVALASFLRFYGLKNQLWLDEVSALVDSYRNSFWDILTKFPGHFPHPLYEQLAHGSLRLFGESAFAIRLPAAIFGVAGIVAFYRLARRLSTEGEAFFATALFVVSYHHIYFSQNARGYTLYLFLAILATELLLTLLERMRWQTTLCYCGIAALAAYSQTAGLVLAPSQIVVALVAMRWLPKRDRAAAPKHLLGILALTIALTLALYAPLISDSVGYTASSAASEPPVARGARVIDLVSESIGGLVPAFGHWSILAAAFIVCVVGGWDLIRRHPLAMAALIAPVALSVLSMALLGGALHARFFLLALPSGYLAGARGLSIIGRIMSSRLRTPVWVQPVLGLTVFACAAIPLLAYYSMPKQDFLGALQHVRNAAGHTDQTAAADLAAHVYQKYYAPGLPSVEDLPDLLQAEATGHPVWVITTFEQVENRRRPDLIERLHKDYQLAKVFPASTSGGEMRVYFRAAMVRE